MNLYEQGATLDFDTVLLDAKTGFSKIKNIANIRPNS